MTSRRGSGWVAALAGAALATAPPLAAAQETGGDAPGAANAAAPAGGVDSSDVFMLLGWRNRSAGIPVPGELMTLAVPIVSASPSTGFAMGVGASAAKLLGDPADTTMSSATAAVQLTTKRQLLVSLRSVVLTSRNDWELLGDWRYYEYAEPTYGLGTASPTPVSGGFVANGLDTAGLPGAQPLAFRYLKLHETVFRRVRGAAYVGAGYHLDRWSDIRDEALDLAAAPPAVTSHYAWSRALGFDPTSYATSGLSLDALYDSRDHTLDPQRGVYARVTWQLSPTWLGSSRASSVVDAELRTYLGLDARRPRHLVGFWAFTTAVVAGEVPYLALPAIGYDTRMRSGRGYAAGRFRGDALAYGEIEYRFPLTRSGILGGVAFVNATTASRRGVSRPDLGVEIPASKLFDATRPGAGVGVRVMADRRARMNVALDLGFGAGGSTGLYLAVGETF